MRTYSPSESPARGHPLPLPRCYCTIDISPQQCTAVVVEITFQVYSRQDLFICGWYLPFRVAFGRLEILAPSSLPVLVRYVNSMIALARD